jgi:predicted Zn-dependent peptidase
MGTGRDDVPKLIPVVCDEVRKAIDGVTDAEVNRARAQIKSGLLMSLESPSSRCVQRARQLLIYGRPLSTAETIARVEEVTGEGITRVAARVFASAPTLAALGPLKRLESFDAIRARLA